MAGARIDDHRFDLLAIADLPEVVTRYLAAHNGRDYRGRDAVEKWLNRATSEYTYTTTLLGVAYEGPGRYDVVQRLEGDFPGTRVDLHHRFTLDGTLISRLIIAP